MPTQFAACLPICSRLHDSWAYCTFLGQILSGPSFSIVEMRRYPLGDNRFEYRIVLLHSATDTGPASLHFSRATRGPDCSVLFARACRDWYSQENTVCVSVTLEPLPPMEHTEHLGLPWEK